MVHIAVLVSGGGTNLQALLDAQEAGAIRNGRIVKVIASRPDAYALERAAAKRVPTAVVSRKAYATPKPLTRPSWPSWRLAGRSWWCSRASSPFWGRR